MNAQNPLAALPTALGMDRQFVRVTAAFFVGACVASAALVGIVFAIA